MKTKTNLMIICFLALFMASASIKTTAQIVYTDIPDTTIFIPNIVNIDSANFLNLDLNNDDNPDYRFAASNIYDYNNGHPIIGKILFINQFFYDNLSRVYGGCRGNFSYFVKESDTINIEKPWYYLGDIYYYQTNGPWECLEVPTVDFFFGLKLVVNIDTLYGWVRCCATDTSVTIKDYAYNTVPNASILAGQTIAGVDSDSLNALIHIYSSIGTLFIEFNGFTTIQGNIQILNIAGQIIKSSQINGAHNVITLGGMSNGVYIVKVVMPDIVVNKKMYLQAI